MHEFESNHDQAAELLTTRFSRRTALKKAGALVALGASANLLNYDNLAHLRVPFLGEHVHVPWDYSLRKVERDYHTITDEERQELLGNGEFEPLPLLNTDNHFSEEGTYDISFELDADQLVSLDLNLDINKEPDNQNLAPVALAQFQDFTYQLPVLITPEIAEQHIPLRFAKQGENSVRILRTAASGNMNTDNLHVGISRPKEPSPIYSAILNTLPIVGMRSDNFLNFLREDATEEEQRRALIRQAAFFYEVELKEHESDSNLLVAEVWRGGRDETPRDPKSLYNETGRLYDYDPIQLVFLDRLGNIYRIDYQTDDLLSHQIKTAYAFPSPQQANSIEVAEQCLFHEIQNLGAKKKGTGHGMVGKGLEAIAIEGRDYDITIVSSFIPPVRPPKTIAEMTSKKDIEIELSRQRLGVEANFENLLESIGTPNTVKSDGDISDSSPEKLFLDFVGEQVDEQLANLENIS
jgi:hypothetical protein